MGTNLIQSFHPTQKPTFRQSIGLMASVPAAITCAVPRPRAGSRQGKHRLGMVPH